MSNVVLLIIQIVSLFLEKTKGHKDCPDGVCDDGIALANELSAKVAAPNVSFGIFDAFKLFRCLPMDRVFDVIGRVKKLLSECDRCPDGDCSFFDLLDCIDIDEAVAIGKEVLSIIRDSKFCIDGGSNEITLGEAG